jgi:hypothetical protein
MQGDRLPVDIRAMKTAIQKDTLKKRLLEVCIQKQYTLIEDFKSRINSLLSSEGLGNEEMYDNNELSQNSQKTNEVNSLNEELEFANRELVVLTRLTEQVSKQHETVESGSLVATNHGSFFISVSTEQMDLDGESFIGISTHSPLFVAMQGKQKGGRFICNGTSYKIKSIL